MAFRLYIVPVVGTGVGHDDRRPKYFLSDANGAGNTGIIDSTQLWSAIDYGFEPWMVVGANLTTSDDNLIVGKADGFALPFDLAPNLTSQQVTAVKNKLDAINVPSNWVSTALSWLETVRTVLGVFLFIQRFGIIYAEANGTVPPSIFTGGVSLSTTFNSLPLAVRNALTSTAADQNISTAGITGSTTLRVILKQMADAYQGRQYNFSGTMI